MNPPRILIVDDDRNIQHVLRVCLEGSGYAIDQATDGAQALEAINSLLPDLVLLDLAMPVLDGLTVLADLRSIIPEGGTRVIVMTAHGSVRTAIQAARLGAADFLEKPFKPSELRQSAASVLDETAHDAAGGFHEALAAVRDSLRRGKFIAAEAALTKAGFIGDGDRRYLNLAGVLHEAHGRRASARIFYLKAIAADPRYEPARRNLERLDQFERTGSTRLEIAFGDDAISADHETRPSASDRFREVLHGKDNRDEACVGIETSTMAEGGGARVSRTRNLGRGGHPFR